MDTFPSVWYRRPVAPHLPDEIPPHLRPWAAAEAREALEGLWRTHTGLWVNHPDHNRLASSKQEQLEIARELGFDAPPTLVTNDPEEARTFASDHRSVVCKPLRGGSVPTRDGEHLFFTTRLDSKQLAALDDLGPEPYLFQALVAKECDVRVTVIDDKAFAVRIDSQIDEDAQVDWRRHSAGLEHAELELPGPIEERCLKLVRHYDLHFGAIDLALRPDGGYSFFELNPNGQWAWIEQLTGQPLRARLADLLLKPC
jgi:glutathione synthase/RimK-type ligase-like ATP-grasp enzyme